MVGNLLPVRLPFLPSYIGGVGISTQRCGHWHRRPRVAEAHPGLWRGARAPPLLTSKEAEPSRQARRCVEIPCPSPPLNSALAPPAACRPSARQSSKAPPPSCQRLRAACRTCQLNTSQRSSLPARGSQVAQLRSVQQLRPAAAPEGSGAWQWGRTGGGVGALGRGARGHWAGEPLPHSFVGSAAVRRARGAGARVGDVAPAPRQPRRPRRRLGVSSRVPVRLRHQHGRRHGCAAPRRLGVPRVIVLAAAAHVLGDLGVGAGLLAHVLVVWEGEDGEGLALELRPQAGDAFVVRLPGAKERRRGVRGIQGWWGRVGGPPSSCLRTTRR